MKLEYLPPGAPDGPLILLFEFDLAPSSDFHFGVLSLRPQSLPCASWKGGAFDTRAATPPELVQ